MSSSSSNAIPGDETDPAGDQVPVEVVGESFDAWNHKMMLYLCTVVLVLSFLLEVRPDDGVSFRFLPDWRLPDTCGMRRLAGVDCPGCGLTRSFIHLAEGDWRASVALHPLGSILALFALLQFPYRIAALRLRTDRPFGRWPKYASWTLIAALIVVWGVRWLPVLFSSLG